MVTHGLDVNAFYLCELNNSNPTPLLACYAANHFDLDLDDPEDFKQFENSLHCRRILLDAGADPVLFLDSDPEAVSALGESIGDSPMVSHDLDTIS